MQGHAYLATLCIVLACERLKLEENKITALITSDSNKQRTKQKHEQTLPTTRKQRTNHKNLFTYSTDLVDKNNDFYVNQSHNASGPIYTVTMQL